MRFITLLFASLVSLPAFSQDSSLELLSGLEDASSASTICECPNLGVLNGRAVLYDQLMSEIISVNPVEGYGSRVTLIDGLIGTNPVEVISRNTSSEVILLSLNLGAPEREVIAFNGVRRFNVSRSEL